MKKMIYAHRGASYLAPENTIPAFLLAVQHKADGIEIDVHLTTDNKIVVIHDERIDRTSTGRGRVKDMTLAQLNSYDYTCGFQKEYDKIHIPQLFEVLEIIKDNNMQLNIEIKNNVIEYANFEQMVIDEVKRFDIMDSVFLSSFNHTSMVKAKQIDGNIRTALLYSSKIHDAGVYAKRCNAYALHPKFESVDERLIDSAKANGIIVNTWTVDDPKLYDVYDVDGIITNRPDVMR